MDLGPPPPQVVHHQHHHHHLPRALLLQHLRPVSNMDSGLYSTSDSEQEEGGSAPKKSPRGEDRGGSDEDAPLPPLPSSSPRNQATPSPSDGRPPRPPKSSSTGEPSKSQIKQHSPSSSSGHHSTTSSLKVKSAPPSPHQQQLLLNVSTTPTGSGAASSPSPASSGSPGTEMITKLRREVEGLKSKFLESQRHWHEVG